MIWDLHVRAVELLNGRASCLDPIRQRVQVGGWQVTAPRELPSQFRSESAVVRLI